MMLLEMEAAGVATAAKKRPRPIPLLVVRGVSDFADERKNDLDSTQSGLFRKYALFNAFNFTVAFLRSNGFQALNIIRLKKKIIDDTELSEEKIIDSFLQSILEELTMKKTEYSKQYPQIDQSDNIFAAMYFNAQAHEYDQLLAHINTILQKLPSASFTDRKFAIDLRRTLKNIAIQSYQIQNLIDIGLKVSPGHSEGRSMKLRTKEITRMIQDEILPTVEQHFGSRGVPTGLNIQIHVLTRMMDELCMPLNELNKTLQVLFDSR